MKNGRGDYYEMMKQLEIVFPDSKSVEIYSKFKVIQNCLKNPFEKITGGSLPAVSRSKSEGVLLPLQFQSEKH